MKNFVWFYGLLAVLNTVAGLDLLAEGRFFEPVSQGIQVFDFGFTLAMGVWAICLLVADRVKK